MNKKRLLALGSFLSIISIVFAVGLVSRVEAAATILCDNGRTEQIPTGVLTPQDVKDFKAADTCGTGPNGSEPGGPPKAPLAATPTPPGGTPGTGVAAGGSSFLPGSVDLPNGSLKDSNVRKVIDIGLAIAGAIAVIIITVSGFRYVISQGDPQAVAKAKNGIINAVIGLVICMLAISIVTFVIPKL